MIFGEPMGRPYIGADWQQIIDGPLGITRRVVDEFREYAKNEAYVDADILLNKQARYNRKGAVHGHPLRQGS